MGAPNKYTVEKIAIVLKQTHGKITLTADILGASYNTIKKYVDRSPTLQAIIEHYRVRIVDRAELKFEAAVQRGEPWAVSMALKTLGKDRGYTERSELTGKDGKPLVVEWDQVDD